VDLHNAFVATFNCFLCCSSSHQEGDKHIQTVHLQLASSAVLPMDVNCRS